MFPIIASVALASEAAPAASSEPQPVSGSLAAIVTSDDYPAEALDRNEQGTVGVLIRVDDKGAVSDCVVQESSGSAALDTQTCRLVWLRAKFKPARDKSGKAVAGTKQTRISWRIAEELAPSEPWALRAIVSLARGRSPTCRVEVEGALKRQMPTEAETACPAGSQAAVTELEKISEAFAELVTEQRFAIGARPKTLMPAGDRLLGQQLAELEVDAAGNLTSCKILESTGTMPPGFPDVCSVVGKHYVPKKAPDGGPAGFTAYFLVAGYFHVERVA